VKSTLDALHYFSLKQDEGDTVTQFEVSDLLYARAKITRRDKVHLWLGANVMLEYDLEEAIQLLETNLKAAETSLKQTGNDLDAIRDGITTLEVNMARVYNYDVRLRRMEREKGPVADQSIS
jgi:prefoldin subunit 5